MSRSHKRKKETIQHRKRTCRGDLRREAEKIVARAVENAKEKDSYFRDGTGVKAIEVPTMCDQVKWRTTEIVKDILDVGSGVMIQLDTVTGYLSIDESEPLKQLVKTAALK